MLVANSILAISSFAPKCATLSVLCSTTRRCNCMMRFARLAPFQTACSIKVSLADWQSKSVMASIVFDIDASPGWIMHNFTLFPSRSTTCTSLPVGGDTFNTCNSRMLVVALSVR